MVKRFVLLALLMPVLGLHAQEQSSTQASSSVETGGLTCYKVEGGYNFIITSKAHARCVFKNKDALEAWYKGETGVGLGINLKWNAEQTLYFGVLSSTRAFVPEGDFLSGNYAGAGADVAVGVGLGAQVLIGGSDKTTGLQPAVATSKGVGVAAGLTYLNLESDPLNNARIATPSGEKFSQALYSAYFDQAYNDYHAPDYTASDHFSARALETTSGKVVPPSVAAEAELIAARERLTAALDGGGREFFPIESARAQVGFDCWAFRIAGGSEVAAIAECKDRFWRWQTPLEGEISNLVAAEMRRRVMMETRVWSIYFDTDSTELNNFAKAALSNLIDIIGVYNEAVVYVEGHTDRAGSKAYNIKLSDARAETVQRELIRGGVPQPWIAEQGYGKVEALQVSTNIHDGSNRRVDIRLVPIEVNTDKL